MRAAPRAAELGVTDLDQSRGGDIDLYVEPDDIEEAAGQRFHGLINVMPQSAKSLALRVAKPAQADREQGEVSRTGRWYRGRSFTKLRRVANGPPRRQL